jgi:hypothetical protein
LRAKRARGAWAAWAPVHWARTAPRRSRPRSGAERPPGLLPGGTRCEAESTRKSLLWGKLPMDRPWCARVLPVRTPMRARSLWTLGLALAIAMVARVARAQTIDEQQEFEKGRYAYRTKDFAGAEVRFRAMLDPVSGSLHDKVLVNQARMYWGAALIATGRTPQALEQFDRILTVDPSFDPDPTVFPAEVGDAFIDTRAGYQKRVLEQKEEEARRERKRKQDEDEAKRAQVARLEQLERLVTEEHVIDRHSRWVALLPGGIGQFQNGNTGLGWFFLSTESLLIVGTLVSVADYYVQNANAKAAFTSLAQRPLAQQYVDRADEALIADQIIFGALAATAIAGIIEAEASYVPQFSSVKARPLPPLPGTSPDAKPTANVPLVQWNFGAAPVFGPGGKGVSGATFGVGGGF